MNDFFWYWPLLLAIGILGTLLGYYWGRRNRPVQNTAKGIDPEKYKKLKKDNFHLRQDADLYRMQAKELEEELFRMGKWNTDPEPALPEDQPQSEPQKIMAVPFDSDLAQRQYGKRIRDNDLKVIEGIGPKIEDLFRSAGIDSWKKLAQCSTEKCRDLLMKGGDRFRMHNPETWPSQARMACEGRWEELANWQESHKNGKPKTPNLD
jgi:predicted flap endonuclease-1-like 5' DNA nuclease